MKLLFDQNLSDQLVTLLADLFPNSTHVKTIGLNTAADTELWDYARDNDYLIVSKDTDFRNLQNVTLFAKLFFSQKKIEHKEHA